MSITPAMRNFVTAEHFAVVGKVLTDQSRYDNKVLRWYKDRNFPVVGVRPDAAPEDVAEGVPVMPLAVGLSATASFFAQDIHCPAINQLLDLPSTSISIIINPAIGLGILKSLFPVPPEPEGNEPRGVWFQPGADSPEIKAYVSERGIEGKVVLGGPCILTSGDFVLAEVKQGDKL